VKNSATQKQSSQPQNETSAGSGISSLFDREPSGGCIGRAGEKPGDELSNMPAH
jgi:hypothetical protein